MLKCRKCGNDLIKDVGAWQAVCGPCNKDRHGVDIGGLTIFFEGPELYKSDRPMDFRDPYGTEEDIGPGGLKKG